MANKQKIETVPPNYTAVTPWIISPSTEKQIAFLAKVFDAGEIPNSRITADDGTIIHVAVKIGDAMVVMFDKRDGWGNTPAFLNIYVPDVDKALECVEEMGATCVTKITELWFGEKVCRILDPFGNLFWINERVKEVDLTDVETVKKLSNTPEAVDGIRYIQSSLNEAMIAQKNFFARQK